MSEDARVKIAFLDRDGVINAYPGHFKYVTCSQEFRLLPGAADGIRELNHCGFKVIVISNQAGVAKGLYTQAALDEMTRLMREHLARDGARVDGVYYCTHHPDAGCGCRKPRTGLIQEAIAAAEKEGSVVDLVRSVFIGDSIIDVETGKAAGIRTILVFSGRESEENRGQWRSMPDSTAQDIVEAARIACSLRD
jgi:D-glycero-D-manno-heptose 1,7-bisphosphate phosphatase